MSEITKKLEYFNTDVLNDYWCVNGINCSRIVYPITKIVKI